MSAYDIRTDLPPTIPEHLLQSWQAALDSVAQLLDVPIVLLTRVVGSRAEVIVSRHSTANPFKVGDATQPTFPELTFRLEFPLLLSDQRVFGALCIMDRRRRSFSSGKRQQVNTVCKLIEGQLSLLPARPQVLSPRRSTELLQAVMDGATDAIFLKDPSGIFLIFNKAAATFIGRQAEEVIGRKAEDIFGAVAGHTIRELELAVLTTGVASTVEETLTTGGQVRTFLTTRSAQRDETGKVIGLIGIARNITAMKAADEELKRSYEALRTARDEAETAERAKSAFLAAMSHEIRTPMNTVIGMTRLALSAELSPRQRNYLEKVDMAAQSLLNIINDVLDFSKIEAGGLVLEETDFHLDTVLASITDVTALRAEEKGLEMIYAVAADVPRELRGDPLRLGQVLINLVSNAVKFTHTGEVVVTVRNRSKLAGRVGLEFSVSDTGIGIEAGDSDGLFLAFTQSGPHISREYGGTGLGLAISRQLVELMGGKIWAKRNPGPGSTFHFTVEVTLPRLSLGTEPLTSHRDIQTRRVLVADDNGRVRDNLVAILDSLGVHAATASSGSETLAAVKAAAQCGQDFDLVLLDWRMPDLDGIETVRQLRTDPQLPRLPAVVMVTAFGREESLQRIEQLGLAGILIRPVTHSQLSDTLHKLFGEGSLLKGALPRPTPAARRGLSIPAEAIASLANRTVLVVDDNLLNQEVISDLLLAVQMNVDLADDGLAAIRSIEGRRYDAVLMDVHMPGVDGLTATRQIRAQSRFASLPIIALTAQVLTEERRATEAAGMNAHLTKPIDEAALYQTLIEVIAQAEHRPLFSLERLGKDSLRLQKLLGDFLRDTEEAPGKLNSLLAASDLAPAAALVHFIRGAAIYMNATALCEIAGRFEVAARTGDAAQARILLSEFIDAFATLRQFLANRLRGLAKDGAPQS